MPKFKNINLSSKFEFLSKIHIDDKTKKIIRNFSILFGIILGMAIILVTTNFLSRSSWKTGLAIEMQTVLDSYDAQKFTVGENLHIKSSVSTSVAVYALQKKGAKSAEKYYGIIARMPSLLGPLPAVFIYDEKQVIFAGYAIDNGKAAETVGMKASNNVLKYWETMIPKIVAKTEAK